MSSTTMPYIIGNWKMNLDVEAAVALADAAAEMANETVESVGIGIAVPTLWIPLISGELCDTSLLVGAQDVSEHENGAHTGDVSAGMLAPWCAFTLIGHSERRQHHGETDARVRAKLDAVLANDMAALLCVGESREQRDVGNALEVVEDQLAIATGHLLPGQLQSLLIAYEPVWAIGTGVTATADDAQQMAAHIRSFLSRISPEAAQSVPVLYGGSVNPENAESFFQQADIDGALVGGASLNADHFLEIVRAARDR